MEKGLLNDSESVRSQRLNSQTGSRERLSMTLGIVGTEVNEEPMKYITIET